MSEMTLPSQSLSGFSSGSVLTRSKISFGLDDLQGMQRGRSDRGHQLVGIERDACHQHLHFHFAQRLALSSAGRRGLLLGV